MNLGFDSQQCICRPIILQWNKEERQTTLPEKGKRDLLRLRGNGEMANAVDTPRQEANQM